jgi:hypothetical protein
VFFSTAVTQAQLVSKLRSPNLVFDPEEHQHNANYNGNRGVLPNQGLTKIFARQDEIRKTVRSGDGQNL